MLELKHIKKIYNPGTISETLLFEDFNLTVPDGEFVSIVGSNGSGKTSMLNIICGSIPIQKGEVLIGGKDIAKMKDFQRYRTIGRVYQDPSAGTCPNLTMLENMSLADNKGKPFGLGRGVNKARENFYKEQLSILGLGLENKMNVKLGALSGGQRQAATLIMATLTPIEFLILDEHTAALDPKTAEKVLGLTQKVISRDHLTSLMITHNMRDALRFGNRLIMMNAGRIVVDVSGEEKKKLTIPDLLSLFEKAAGEELDNDRMMLS